MRRPRIGVAILTMGTRPTRLTEPLDPVAARRTPATRPTTITCAWASTADRAGRADRATGVGRPCHSSPASFSERRRLPANHVATTVTATSSTTEVVRPTEDVTASPSETLDARASAHC